MEYSRISSNNNALFEAFFIIRSRLMRTFVWQSADFCETRFEKINRLAEKPTQSVYFSIVGLPGLRCSAME